MFLIEKSSSCCSISLSTLFSNSFSLTKTNKIGKFNQDPSMKIIPGYNDEGNIEDSKLKKKKAKDLGKKEGKLYIEEN